jgi:hypothetical protein
MAIQPRMARRSPGGHDVDDGGPGVLEHRQEPLVGPGPAHDRLVAGWLLLDVADEGVEPHPEPLVGRQAGADVDLDQQLGGGGPQNGHLQIAGGGEVVEDERLGHAPGPGHGLGRHLVEGNLLHERQADADELGPAGVGAEAPVRDGGTGSGGVNHDRKSN